ncbi:replication protein [Alicyclobacillus sp. ALC3]|uniref:replication protein n=1 Tax=Alicyclobacillus sp. ALC3 TaxID=2796143 RepID=UPI002377FE20|nr:replication protein [Alicyclobacillus sp. ALC3]WDL98151.1 replication protein [Alicyclobacillus sp. ALC3]
MPKGDYQCLKADIEDGVVPIAHLLLEALSMAKLNGVAKGLVLFIWRRTYGWAEEGKKKHKDDRITLAEFASAVNSERTYVSTQLKLLVKAGVVFERQDEENGRYKRYGMNTEIAQWSENVINADNLAEAISAKLYVHSSRNVLQTHNGLANAQPFANTQPLCKSTTKPLCDSTTFAPENLNGGADSRTPKESNEINKKIAAATAADSVREFTDMSGPEFERAVEQRMQINMGNVGYILKNNDFKVLNQLLAEGVPRGRIISGIDEAFAGHVPKHAFDKINSLAYCAPKIYERWQAEVARIEVSVAASFPTGRSTRHAANSRATSQPRGPNGRTTSVTGGKVGRV